ncbi:MAG: hypothetical protein LBI54_08450, partial [Lachnospiraceae bacterium]|nr:hypothetical protein [Lachnospiraceae bacterium]
MKANLDSIVRRLWQNKMLVSFIVVWAITFLFLLITDNRDLIYDSELYFGLSQSFTLDGDFSFRYFPETYRGYFYPFCLLVFRAAALGLFGDHFLGVWIFAALLLAITSCVLLPKLLELLTGRVNQPLACYFAPAALILFFWRGSVIYPDSDLPALCFMLAATVCLYAAGTRADTRPAPTTRRPSPTVNGDSATTSVVGAVGNRPTKANIKTALLYFLAGFFAYGAYNTRTIYLFSALGLVLIYVYLCYKRTSKSSSPLKSKPAILDVILLLLIIAAGVAVAAAPQLYINMHTQGLPSIAVVTTSFAEDTN